MYGTLAGALSGRKIPYDHHSYSAAVDGRIVGIDKTIRIQSIALHYELTVPPESLDTTKRALISHPRGCPAHQSVKGAIEVTWDAVVHVGDQVIKLSSESPEM